MSLGGDQLTEPEALPRPGLTRCACRAKRLGPSGDNPYALPIHSGQLGFLVGRTLVAYHCTAACATSTPPVWSFMELRSIERSRLSGTARSGPASAFNEE